MQMAFRLGLILSLGLLTLLAGCAKRPHLMIDYNVPPAAAGQLKGQKVRLVVQDMRKNKTIMSPGAAQLFPDFENQYSLTWITPENQLQWSGEYPLTGLLAKVMEKRLAQLGVAVADHADPNTPRLTVTVTKLNLNQLGMMWYATLTCEAALTTASGHEAKETVTGSAERARVVGLKGADKLLSQIFSSVLNRIDIHKLFQNAKLI